MPNDDIIDTLNINISEIISSIESRRGKTYSGILSNLFYLCKNMENMEDISCEFTLKNESLIGKIGEVATMNDVQEKQLNHSKAYALENHSLSHVISQASFGCVDAIMIFLENHPSKEFIGMRDDMIILVKRMNKDTGNHREHHKS